MEGDNIAEVRGIAYKQNLDPYMVDTLKEKLEEFPDKEKYLKKENDNKILTSVDKKVKRGEELNKQDLLFLYEINGKIDGFGYREDPRIKDIRSKQDITKVQTIIFECTPSQIATNINEINENTKAYVGGWNVEVYKKLPATVNYVYEKFPETKIFRRSIELTTKTPKEYKKAIEEQGMKIYSYAQDMLDKMKALIKNEQIDLVEFSVEQLGFPDGATLKEIYKKADELGLDLCPSQVGPEVRLAYKDQPNGEYLRIAMEAITGRDDCPGIFYVSRGGDGLWLIGSNGGPDYEWSGDSRFVFRSRK